MNSYFVIILLGLIFGLYSISGCATQSYLSPTPPIESLSGIYHSVEKGQTLWRIAKMYNVDLDEIVRINRIPNITKIGTGQLIFIPGRNTYLGKEINSNIVSKQEDFIWPVKGKILSFFGEKKANRVNKGIDIQTKIGETVISSRKGRVSFCGNLKGYGKTIIIDHADGFFTIYAYNSEILVKPGDEVLQGMPIAKTGLSGRNFIPCLHFEIRKVHIAQNPLYYLP